VLVTWQEVWTRTIQLNREARKARKEKRIYFSGSRNTSPEQLRKLLSLVRAGILRPFLSLRSLRA
jgi:hypothetical protein